MKKRQIKIILITILLVNIALLNAQIKNANDTKEYNNNSYLTVNLLSSLNPFNPRWRVGYIKNINTKWKVGLDFGYGNRNLSFTDFGDKIENGYKLWEIRPELYYIIKPQQKALKYFSIELFYIHHKDLILNESYYTNDYSEYIKYDQANYFRQKYGMNLKYGMMVNLSKKIGLNFYSGLGVRTRDNKYFNVLNPNLADPPIDSLSLINDYRNTEGANFNVNFTLGIKLYFKLNN